MEPKDWIITNDVTRHGSGAGVDLTTRTISLRSPTCGDAAIMVDATLIGQEPRVRVAFVAGGKLGSHFLRARAYAAELAAHVLHFWADSVIEGSYDRPMSDVEVEGAKVTTIGAAALTGVACWFDDLDGAVAGKIL